MANVKGDFNVCRTINAGRRVNQGLNSDTITAAEQLEIHSPWWNRLSAATAQDVILPDATTLSNGWVVVVEANGVSDLTVKTYDAATPVALETVESSRAYEFTLLDNGTEAGEWYVNLLEESDKLAVARYTSTFDATTSWGAASGGYYSIAIAQSVHEKGTSPTIEMYELSGSDYIKLDVDEIKVASNGDVEFRVPETPDCRFAGKVIII